MKKVEVEKLKGFVKKEWDRIFPPRIMFLIKTDPDTYALSKDLLFTTA